MIDWTEAAKQGSLVAAGIAVVVSGALLATRRWWSLRGAGATPASPDDAVSGGPLPATAASALRPRVFWAWLTAILLLAAALRVPLARSSLWWDEVWQARNASVGEFRPDKKNAGQLKFRETTFAQALWNYRKPANHPPMAVASKACHEVWKKLTGAEPGAINEFVLRLPGFAASLAGIALAALLLRAWGLPGAGLVTAFFLALHPWHIRYGIDNRGYTFLIPLTIIGLWSLWRACGPRSGAGAIATPEDGADGARAAAPDDRTAAWAWWVFGVTQALILWSHLLSVWVCLALCATGAWWIWRQHTGADRWRRLARLAAVQVAGAVVFLALFLPNLLQATQWGEKNQDGRLLSGPVLVDTLRQAAMGGEATLTALAVGICALLWLLRARAYAVPGTAGLVALLLGGAVFLTAVWATDFYFYPRFLFAILVPLAIGFGLSAELKHRDVRQFAPWMPSWYDNRWFFAFLACCFLGFHVAPLFNRGFSPLREAAAELRQAEAAGASVFGYGFGAEALQYYLPTLPYAREADAPQALAAALESARAAGKPLYVATGYEELNRLNLPDGFRLLDDPARSRVVWSQNGLEPQFAYRIWRLD